MEKNMKKTEGRFIRTPENDETWFEGSVKVKTFRWSD